MNQGMSWPCPVYHSRATNGFHAMYYWNMEWILCASYLSLQMLVLVSFCILYYVSDDRNMRGGDFSDSVWSEILSGNLCGLTGLPFTVCLAAFQWDCTVFSVGAAGVLTAVTVCLAGWGSLMWVRSLQFVSTFSNCCVANNSLKKKCQS